MLGEEVSEPAVLLGQRVFVAGDGGEVFFEPEDFLLQGFDVQFFPLAVGSRMGQYIDREDAKHAIPLCLSV